jgi:sec-independent protein translocase protein TatA
MIGYSLNIVGSEWIIIIFVALVLILGTNQLPSAARKLGRAVNEYNKAKNEVQNHMKDITNHNLEVSGPVESERQKLEMIAKTLGVRVEEKSDEELREIISSKIGRRGAEQNKDNPEG